MVARIAARSGCSVRPEFGVQDAWPIVVRQIAIHQDVSPIDRRELSLTLQLSEVAVGRKDDRRLDSLRVPNRRQQANDLLGGTGLRELAGDSSLQPGGHAPLASSLPG
jgi:hypothetical protein